MRFTKVRVKIKNEENCFLMLSRLKIHIILLDGVRSTDNTSYIMCETMSRHPSTEHKWYKHFAKQYKGVVHQNLQPLHSEQYIHILIYRPLSRRLDRCDRVIQIESRDPFGGNVYYVTMQITFFTRKFRNVERNLHCDIVHITTKWVSSLTLDCNGVYAIKAYRSFHVYQHLTSFSHMRGALVGRRTTAAGFYMQNMCDV